MRRIKAKGRRIRRYIQFVEEAKKQFLMRQIQNKRRRMSGVLSENDVDSDIMQDA